MSSRRGQASPAATSLVAGAVAGTVATVAMTLAADALFRRLPAQERYPLPPRELTERIFEELDADRPIGEDGRMATSLAAHVGFGAAAGALFSLLKRRIPLSPVAGASAYAVGIWTASYLGWVPALGLLNSAIAHPSRRNALMVGVHIVWGCVLGVVHQRLLRSMEPLRHGRIGDRR